jgi:gamma-glutamyl phosphate reductase
MPWDSVTLRGNPTKSTEVNDVINKILKHEVRKEGVPTRAVRTLEYNEFLSVWAIIKAILYR